MYHFLFLFEHASLLIVCNLTFPFFFCSCLMIGSFFKKKKRERVKIGNALATNILNLQPCIIDCISKNPLLSYNAPVIFKQPRPEALPLLHKPQLWVNWPYNWTSNIRKGRNIIVGIWLIKKLTHEILRVRASKQLYY